MPGSRAAGYPHYFSSVCVYIILEVSRAVQLYRYKYVLHNPMCLSFYISFVLLLMNEIKTSHKTIRAEIQHNSNS